MKTYILDTNYIQSLISVDDINHKKALLLEQKLEYPNTIIIPQLVVAELMAGPSSEILNMYDVCSELADKLEGTTRKDLISISKMSYKIRKKLKANDLLILAICIRLNGELVTFDKKLNKIALAYSQSIDV